MKSIKRTVVYNTQDQWARSCPFQASRRTCSLFVDPYLECRAYWIPAYQEGEEPPAECPLRSGDIRVTMHEGRGPEVDLLDKAMEIENEQGKK